MNRLKRYQTAFLLLCICLTCVPVSYAQTTAVSEPKPDNTFKFNKVDLDLLEQVNLLDEKFDKEGVVYNDETLSTYLNRVGKAVIPAGTKLENVEWNFRVLRDPIPNAFALPNGSIYVNTGLLALLDDEAQLASVLAHEVSHVLNRHTYIQNRSNRNKILAINVIETIGFWNPAGGVAGLTIGLITTVSPFILATSMFGYSRELEKEADLKGLNLLTAAGYPPEEMAGAFKLMEKDIEGEQLKLFYSDHPQLEDRIAYVSKAAQNSSVKSVSAERLGTAKAEYLSSIEKVSQHDVQLAINNGRYRTALFISRKLVEFNPRSSEDYFWLAESYRTLGPRTPELAPKELTSGAKKDAAKKRSKLTLEEEEIKLMKTATGQAFWKANQQKAESLYLQSLELDISNYRAHRGLGMLYEKNLRRQEAVNEYEKYLELAPEAPDKERISRRLENLKKP